MGLAERRAIKAVQDDTIPAAKAMIKNLSGADVAIELDAPSCEADPNCMSDDFPWTLKHYAFESLESALREICQDAMGKQAVQDGFKKMVVRHVVSGTSRKLAFAGGVLTLEEQLNGGEYYTSSQLKKVLESGL